MHNPMSQKKNGMQIGAYWREEMHNPMSQKKWDANWGLLAGGNAQLSERRE
jgi:hypothetical protein